MKGKAAIVASMTKVSLRIASASEPDANGVTGHRIEFIYGIGSQGLTPFEQALYGKTIGERMNLEIASGQWGEFFGHLTCQLPGELTLLASERLTATVVDITTADNREVVKALAQAAGCGGDCNCGCGC